MGRGWDGWPTWHGSYRSGSSRFPSTRGQALPTALHCRSACWYWWLDMLDLTLIKNVQGGAHAVWAACSTWQLQNSTTTKGYQGTEANLSFKLCATTAC